MLNMFKKMLDMLIKKMLNMSKEATQSKWDNLTAWVYSTCTQVPERAFKFIMSSYCK